MTLRVLVVEDDDVAAEAIERSMRRAHIPISMVLAEDGLVALDILRGKHPTKSIQSPLLVLLDINMPRMNGFEFLDELRADEKLHPTVVFMLTTSASESDIAKAYNKNIAGFMVKDTVGEHFKHLFNLLECYSQTVLLPV